MTVIKHPGQRVAIFIDAQNLYHSAKNLYHAKVNFGNIVRDVVGKRSLIRALAYVITTEAGDERAFFDALIKMGIETKTKDLQIFAGGSKKADWDVGMAVDAIKMASKVDAIILITGDGDFVPLVQYLQTKEGCQVEVVAFSRSTSGKLIEAADDFFDLDENASRYLIGGRKSGKHYRTNESSHRENRGDRKEGVSRGEEGDSVVDHPQTERASGTIHSSDDTLS